MRFRENMVIGGSALTAAVAETTLSLGCDTEQGGSLVLYNVEKIVKWLRKRSSKFYVLVGLNAASNVQRKGVAQDKFQICRT